MKFKVIVHTPSGKTQHIIRADSEDAARVRASMAHPLAEVIEVEEIGGSSS